MPRILSLSSQVVHGAVGLSAIVPALQRLGHEVLAMPTILLSNHPGHQRSSGCRVDVTALEGMLDVLDANDWLAGLDAVMTGYLPTADHVAVAVRALDLVRRRSPEAMLLVDPVLGDDPRGLYVDVAAANAVRDHLIPRATVTTPNRFELSWLAGFDVQSARDARAAAERLAPKQVLATSIPFGAGAIANIDLEGGASAACPVRRLPKVPHGTGDLLSGLYVGHRLCGVTRDAALGRAVAGVEQAIAQSLGDTDLHLTIGPETTDWTRAPPLEVEQL
jgi:pyridoxine kinase